MNRTYLVVPLVSMAVFAAFFLWQRPQLSQPRVDAAAADEYAARDGRKEAEADVAAGKLVLIETGVKLAWDRERREVALGTYGVELRRLPAEPATEAFARYVDSYNRVMRPKILSRHGAGFFDALHRDAIALMESRRGEKVPPTPAGR